MREQAKQIAKGLWEANQELAEEIAHEIYELRDDPKSEEHISRFCSNCKFWNNLDVAEIYGSDVCSQYHKAKFNRKDRALVKIRTEADFCCSLWESRDD